MQRTDQPMALDHLRVLELPGLAGAYCGKLLADLGADVIKIEPPGGDPMRFTGPYAGDVADPERSLPFINYHTNKRSAVIELESEEGRATLRSLVPTVDVIIDTFTPGDLDRLGLGYEALKALNPNIVLTSITSFGQHGLYSRFHGSDLVAGAMSGITATQGDPDMPPCNGPLDLGYQMASIHGAIATLFVLYQRPIVGHGDHIDISVQEVLGHINFPMSRYDLEVAIPERPGGRSLNIGINAYPVADGWVHIYARRWERLQEWLNNPAFETGDWQNRHYRQANADRADPLIAEFTRTMTKAAITEEGQKRGIPTAPVSTTADFVNSPHIQARGFFQEIVHPVLGAIKVTGAPYRLSETPVRIRRSTPLLGEHTAEVLAETSKPRPRIEVRTPSERAAAAAAANPKLPFKGIRVLDFTIAFAGPFGTRYLAELGAEVIKVESNNAATNTGDPNAPALNQVEINRSKRSITLDLHYPKAQELARQLAMKSDFVTVNFRPHTMERWGLGYEHLKAIKPDIIMAEMPGFGNDGPAEHYTSLGQTLMAYSGLMRLWGHPESDENKRCKFAYPDWIGAGKVVTSLLAALNYRERTGKGQYIEVAQVEGAAAMIGVAYLDYLINRRIVGPQGNRHLTFAPHNVFPCRGEDRWVAIGVTTDEQWSNLVQAIGATDWTADESLATAAGRKARELELEARIGEWTRQYTPHQAMRLLQRAGVPAGAVQNGEDMWFDPHLRERGYSTMVEQPFLGPNLEAGLTMTFKETPKTQPRGMAVMGEGNEYVFGEVLGLSTAEIKQLIADKIIN